MPLLSASSCPPLLAPIVPFFCGKEARAVNICLIAVSPTRSPRRNLLLARRKEKEKKKGKKGVKKKTPRLVNGGREPRRILCTCRPSNRDHERSSHLPPPPRLSLARHRFPCKIVHACAPIDNAVRRAIWNVAPADLRGVQIPAFDSISRVSSVTQTRTRIRGFAILHLEISVRASGVRFFGEGREEARRVVT